MNSYLHKLSIIISSLWVGGLWSMLMVTTILFNKEGKEFARVIANDMFAFMNLFGMFSSVYLFIYGFRKENFYFLKSITFWLLVLMLSLTLISYFGINPILEKFDYQLIFALKSYYYLYALLFLFFAISTAFLIECFLGIFLILKIR